MDKAKKKRVKRYITWAAMALVVALLTVMPLLAQTEAEADGPVASVLSATVETGDISSTLHGGGTIAADDVENVTLPSGVKLTEFLVKNGEVVTEGAPLAAVDKVSVMTAITGVTETLEYLREELEDARDEKVSSSVTATAGGRVKKVFAQAGEAVQEVMLRDGALAILSLDGLMAVKLEKALDISTGEHVTVTLADGEAVTGRVESNLDGVVVITVEDESYEVGQTVTVTSDQGQRLGQGTLYIHNAWKATAYSGTIENVNAREEKTVSSGAALFTLTDRDFEGELQYRAGQHREYEELLQELFQMYESGVITAPCDGEVSGVDEDSPYLLSAAPEGWVVAPLNNVTGNSEEKGWTVMLLSATETTPGCTDDGDCPLEGPDAVHGENCIRNCGRTPACTAKTHYSDCQSLCTGKAGCLALQAKHLASCPEKCTNNANCISSRPVEEHGSNCIVHCTKDIDGSDGFQCQATTHYETCIGKCIRNNQCEALNHQSDCYYYNLTYTARVAIAVRTVSGVIEYKYDKAAPSVSVVKGPNGTWTVAAFPETSTMNDTGFVPSNGVSCDQGDVILIITGTNANDEVVISDQVYVYKQSGSSTGGFGAGSFGGFGGFGGMNISGMIGGLSGFGSYSAGTTTETEDLFDLEGETLLTVTPHDTATLTISLDEHDIAKVSLGQKATVKLEALKDEEFEAEVTAIAVSGTNNGGSSKFAVELTLPMSADMISGMSATAILPLEQRQDVTILPLAALLQQGAKTMVYTALDEEGNPANPVEVTTGISDGEKVEILSGLQLGQRVYYSYYDTLELDTSAEADRYTFR